MILKVVDYSSAAYYGIQKSRQEMKRWPKINLTDEDLLKEIRKTMDAIPFHGTGYKKFMQEFLENSAIRA